MSKVSQALSGIPDSHKKPLLAEYKLIVQNYAEQRWSPSEMSGGLFSEIVFSILEGIADGKYASKPIKPSDMPKACKQIENKQGLPRSFQILIPRILPALYEIRNNRGVGHVGSVVDPNHMDATLVLSMANWIMAELVRELHSLPILEAQKLVDQLAERRIPLIWENGDIRRVLDIKMSSKDQILLLLASTPDKVHLDDLLKWTEYKNKTRFIGILEKFHSERMLEFDKKSRVIELLPPGSKYISDRISKK